MDTYPGLPRELQEIENELQSAYTKGGLQACEAVLNRLAAEATFAQVVVDETDLAILEAEEDTDTFPEIRESAAERLQELEQINLEAKKVLARHAYAVARLQTIGKDTP